MKIMEDTCTHIAIQKQLKNSDSGICKQIYTPQQYNQNKKYMPRRKPRYSQSYSHKSQSTARGIFINHKGLIVLYATI